MRRRNVGDRKAAADVDRLRADLHLRPALASASTQGDGVDDLVDGGVDPEHGAVAEHPDAASTDLHLGGRHRQSDRAHNVSGSRVDPQERLAVVVADPDGTLPDGGPRRSAADGNLVDDRIRRGIDDDERVAFQYQSLRWA
jgi:hypothetical protein